MALIISKRILVLFSSEPPYLSVRLLTAGETNWLRR